MSMTVAVFVLAVIFMVIVLPLWLVMSYLSTSRKAATFSDEDKNAVAEMLVSIDQLSGRIESLERILNQNYQGWNRLNDEEK